MISDCNLWKFEIGLDSICNNILRFAMTICKMSSQTPKSWQTESNSDQWARSWPQYWHPSHFKSLFLSGDIYHVSSSVATKCKQHKPQPCKPPAHSHPSITTYGGIRFWEKVHFFGKRVHLFGTALSFLNPFSGKRVHFFMHSLPEKVHFFPKTDSLNFFWDSLLVLWALVYG